MKFFRWATDRLGKREGVVCFVTNNSFVDQIAFDPEKKRVYCASSTGVISVVEETADGAVSLGNVKTAPGAKTITVDPKTHAVWIAYADKEHSYVRRLTAQ